MWYFWLTQCLLSTSYPVNIWGAQGPHFFPWSTWSISLLSRLHLVLSSETAYCSGNPNKSVKQAASRLISTKGQSNTSWMIEWGHRFLYKDTKIIHLVDLTVWLYGAVESISAFFFLVYVDVIRWVQPPRYRMSEGKIVIHYFLSYQGPFLRNLVHGLSKNPSDVGVNPKSQGRYISLSSQTHPWWSSAPLIWHVMLHRFAIVMFC